MSSKRKKKKKKKKKTPKKKKEKRIGMPGWDGVCSRQDVSSSLVEHALSRYETLYVGSQVGVDCTSTC